MSEPSVIIIGAGLGGLSAGCYARMNNYPCQIFEHGRHPGGVAAEWKRQGYTIDGGIHFYMGYRPGQPDHDLYRELGVYQEDQYQEMKIYGRFLDPAASRSLDVTQDLDLLAQTMKAISPKDEAFIKKVLKGATVFGHADMTESMKKPPDMSNWRDTLKMFMVMRKRLRYFTKYYLQPMNQATRALEDPWLAHVFNNLFLPDVPVIFDMMLLGLLSKGNMAVRRDGSGGFARALEKRYLDLGGKVTYRSTVEKILVKGDRAVGVRLSSGEEYRADRIISAADGFSTLYELLDGRYVTKQLKDIHETWPLFKPVVLINYGVAREFKNEPSTIILKPASEVKAGYLANDLLIVRIFNYGPVYAPEGKSLVQVMIESAWQPWKDLREDEEAYKAEKEKTAAQVLACLNDVWPGIRDQVEMTNMATPYTWWRYTRNRRGAFEGFAVTPRMFTSQVRRSLPGLENFYMAGQWVVPGGGVIPTLVSGKHAAMLLCRQDNKPFHVMYADA